jgi:ornithine cyclodeaminase
VLGFKTFLGISEFRAFDVDMSATRKLVRNMAGVNGIRIISAKSAREAVVGADIVTTCTADKTRATILMPDMVEPGMHINGLGGDCPSKTELHPDLLRKARIIVEFEPQTRIEGDIQQLPIDFPVVELWQVLAGKEPGRQSANQVTVFDSVGFALADFSSLRPLRDLAGARGVGKTLKLIPELSDPKDLYALIRAEPTPLSQGL